MRSSSSTSSQQAIRFTQWIGQLTQELGSHSFEGKPLGVVIKELLELDQKVSQLKEALGAATDSIPCSRDGTTEEFLQRQLLHKSWTLSELELTLEIAWLSAVRRAGAEQDWTSHGRGS
ncbi:MAG: hypothetical protein HY473_00800 [Candidatus Sungbacteria bacterium]|uniref:Uncharacterized protein n=1 Tax=Candidatus Sungiibacteriota bacterium TaxID=2750080 RepID=A0A933DRY3_9BACT|nr:hypothetical protein [Candidatus Sungbacteria bacterium]